MAWETATFSQIQGSKSRLRNLSSKFRGPSGVINILVIILGMVNIGIVGYNFSYFKGTWRNNLFHSELTYVVIFCACFIGTCVIVIGNIMSPQQPYATNTVHEMVSSAIYGFLSALASTVLLIQLSAYGRFFVNSFEVKMFSSILGLVQAAFYLLNAFILHKNAQSLT